MSDISAVPRPIRVAIVDDDAEMRGIAFDVLEYADGIEVVAEAADGMEAATVARRHAPDVMLMDIRMPGRDGVVTTEEVLRIQPAVRIIAMTAMDAEGLALRMVEAGAAGFVTKTRFADDVAAAIQAVHRGEAFLSPGATLELMRAVRAAAPAPEVVEARTLLATLSPRELQVAELIADGAKNPTIAEALGIEVTTVRTHVEAVRVKLGVDNNMHVGMQMYRAGYRPAA